MRVKQLQLSVILALSFLLGNASASTITGNVAQVWSAAVTNSRVTFTPGSTPVIISNTLYVSQPANIKCTNGTFSTPLIVGKYAMRVDDVQRDLLTIYVPNDTNTYNFSDLVTNAVNFASTNAFAFIVRTNGTGMSNTFTAPLLWPLNFTTNTPGKVWTSVGTNGGGSWSNSAGGSGGVSDATLVTASNRIWVSKVNATNGVLFGTVAVQSNMLFDIGSSVDVVEIGNGVVDVGSGKAKMTSSIFELNAPGGGSGFRIYNDDVIDYTWYIHGDGTMTNYGRAGFRDGITVYGNDAGLIWSNSAAVYAATASNSLNASIIAATNSASVTNWINSRQAASANLTNWSLIPTGAMANVVAANYLTNRADTNYTLANNLSNAVNTANVALSNLAYAIGTAATNYANARDTNYITTAAGTGTNTTLTDATNSHAITFTNRAQIFSDNLTTGLVVNAQSVALTNAAELFSVRTNGTTYAFQVSGVGAFGNGSRAAPGITFGSYGGIGIYALSANYAEFVSGSSKGVFAINDGSSINYVQLSANARITATPNNDDPSVASDTLLMRRLAPGIAATTNLNVANGVLIISNGAVKIGLNGGALTNTLYVSATLDFPSTAAGAVSDLPVTLSGASDGDIVSLGLPSGSITTLTGSYIAWASNGVCYVRFANNNLVSAQDPVSGTFKLRVDKFQ